MRLSKARVQSYRSIIDTDYFDIEELKTILVGPNEAGKTVVLQALQYLNKPDEVPDLDPLRDFPRSLYNQIDSKQVDPDDVLIVEGFFKLEEKDKASIPTSYHDAVFVRDVYLDSEIYDRLESVPDLPKLVEIKPDLLRLSSHIDKLLIKSVENEDGDEGVELSTETLKNIIDLKSDDSILEGLLAKNLHEWLEENFANIDEENDKELNRYNKISDLLKQHEEYNQVLEKLAEKIPVFVLFNNYFKVKPSIHLQHLAERTEQNLLDDDNYDYGNLCLLKLLGFTPRELAKIGSLQSPERGQTAQLKTYKDAIDKRRYQLNAASVRLTKEIQEVWKPDPDRPEAGELRLNADAQYLTVVVVDELGVEIELDQRSEGFQWLVSFFVVFFAEAMDKHENAILLLDEPGLNLHGLKQRNFRDTLTTLAEKNQVIYTTHSPFLVGPDELDIVRVVELVDRSVGTKVHLSISTSDPAGLLPLQEALGYDLAHSLFSQQRNLVLEGITDYWYLNTVSMLVSESDELNLRNDIALVFAGDAGKVVYFATILHAHNLKVAALLDSDAAGDHAAQQDSLVHALGHKKIIRTKDFCEGIPKAEIEDLLRATLVEIVKSELNVDLTEVSNKQASRPIVNIFSEKIDNFSKYKLAKLFIKWSKDHELDDLADIEKQNWLQLFDKINKILK